MSPSSPDNRLTRLLHQDDPLADDPGLSPSQTAEIRRTILTRAPVQTASWWPQLSPALTIAALLALALGAAWWPSAIQEPDAPPIHRGEASVTLESSPGAPSTAAGGNSLESRKIQFETPGGTLIVWVLDPNFPS